MRKLIALALSCAVAVSLAGCGGTETVNSQAGEESGKKVRIMIGYENNPASFLPADFKDTSWYRIIHATGKAQWFVPHEDSHVVRPPGISFVSIGIPFIDKATGGTEGVVLADIESDRLSEIAGPGGNRSRTYI